MAEFKGFPKDFFTFFEELKKNNNRDWFNTNKSRYHESVVNPMGEYITSIAPQLESISPFYIADPRAHGGSMFRIYRDTRFSKDKTPYKTNWGGGLKREGAENRGGYYYQVGPKGSFVMGGFFGPNKEDLLHIRKQIDQDSDQLRDILSSKQFKNFFGTLNGSMLKTAPRGFEKDSPNIDLLRYKSFTLRHDFTENEVNSKDFPRIMSHAFQQMRPFFDYMSEILTTDLNGRSML